MNIKNSLKKLLEKSKSKAPIVTKIGALIVIVEIIFRFFSVDTSHYFIFSGTLHWLIILYLVVLKTELTPHKKVERDTQFQDIGFLEKFLKEIASTLMVVLFLGVVILLYSTIGSPSGEILFQEGDKVLVQNGHILHVLSLKEFYMYKHYRYIIGLFLLLFIYFRVMIPFAMELQDER
jgi:hypothetical protein